MNRLVSLSDIPSVISFPLFEECLPEQQCATPSRTRCRGCGLVLDIAGVWCRHVGPKQRCVFGDGGSNWQVKRSGLSRNTGALLASSAHFGERRRRPGQAQMKPNNMYGVLPPEVDAMCEMSPCQVSVVSLTAGRMLLMFVLFVNWRLEPPPPLSCCKTSRTVRWF